MLLVYLVLLLLAPGHGGVARRRGGWRSQLWASGCVGVALLVVLFQLVYFIYMVFQTVMVVLFVFACSFCCFRPSLSSHVVVKQRSIHRPRLHAHLS